MPRAFCRMVAARFFISYTLPIFILSSLSAATGIGTSDDGPRCICTTMDPSRKLSPCAQAPAIEVSSSSSPPSSSDELVVIQDMTGERQTMLGFGAAWTDATVEAFSSLSDDSQERLLAELFTAHEENGTAALGEAGGGGGIKIELVRHTAGQSDLTPADIAPWSYDEFPGDVGLANFTLGEPGTQMVEWLKRMRAVAEGQSEGIGAVNITLLGSLWTPPLWMKHPVTNQLLDQYHAAYEDYIVKYVAAFRDGGVAVDAITLQNEPLHGEGDHHFTMFMGPALAVELSAGVRAKLDVSGQGACARVDRAGNEGTQLSSLVGSLRLDSGRVVRNAEGTLWQVPIRMIGRIIGWRIWIWIWIWMAARWPLHQPITHSTVWWSPSVFLSFVDILA